MHSIVSCILLFEPERRSFILIKNGDRSERDYTIFVILLNFKYFKTNTLQKKKRVIPIGQTTENVMVLEKKFAFYLTEYTYRISHMFPRRDCTRVCCSYTNRVFKT